MKKNDELPRSRTVPTVSRLLPNGDILELVYDRAAKRTQFAIGQGGDVRLADDCELSGDIRLVPYSPENNLIRHEVLLLAGQPEPFDSVPDLAERIDEYLRRYVDLSDDFRTVATYYVLLTWVYDAFNEVPYLRFRGDFGSGKTRALWVIGSLCNKAFFASGASTVSPIFHTLDTFRGTLLFDEADFRFSDEKAELVKILNNGNVRGFPVLRTAITQKKEFEPRAFTVYGPKLVAMRRSYEDEALESRFFTEEMGRRPLRPEIPINLPETQREEALGLRNALLGYRFAVLRKLAAEPSHVDPDVSPRLNQILVPLLSIVEDDRVRERIREAVSRAHVGDVPSERQRIARTLLVLLAEAHRGNGPFTATVGELTARLIERCGEEVERPITSRYVGAILRERLGLETRKSHGVFVVEGLDATTLVRLCAQYGVPVNSEDETAG